MHLPQRLTLKVSATALAVIFGLSLGALAHAQEAAAAPADAASASVSISAAQVRRGTPLFNDNCASCHGGRLEGVLDGPPLAGAGFQANWFGQPVSQLYDFISTNMPQDRPGALTPEEYADIVAFILRKNDIAPTDGAADLPGDSAALATMMLPAPAAP